MRKYENAWLRKEIFFLRRNYKLGINICCASINRTREAICTKAHRLGLKIDIYWSEKDTLLLKNNYFSRGSIWCSKKLNRPTSAIRCKACSLSLKAKNQDWSNREIKILKKLYPKLGSAPLVKYLKRSRQSIIMRAHMLGVKVNDDFMSNENRENVSHFIKIESPFIAYMLGFLWADGTVAKKTFNIKFGIVNLDFNDIKERWLKTAKKWRYRIDKSKNPNHNDVAIVELNNYQLWTFLKENDYLIKSGASACKILSKIPNNLKHYWWRGYFDGDGSISLSKQSRAATVNIVSVIYQDWTFYRKLCKQLDIKYTIFKRNTPNCKSSAVYFNKKEHIDKFRNYIYKGSKFGLYRKYKKFLEHISKWETKYK